MIWGAIFRHATALALVDWAHVALVQPVREAMLVVHAAAAAEAEHARRDLAKAAALVACRSWERQGKVSMRQDG